MKTLSEWTLSWGSEKLWGRKPLQHAAEELLHFPKFICNSLCIKLKYLTLTHKESWRERDRTDYVKRRALTFTVVAGLGQGLAMGQHGDLGHSDSHHCPLLTRFVLRWNTYTSKQEQYSHKLARSIM